MDQFPKMLFRWPARLGDAIKLPDGSYDTRIAADAPEQDTLQADGWHESSPDARAAGEAAMAEQAAAAQAALQDSAADSKPPSRDELEQMATSLGIAFGPKVSDKKLRALIEAASQPDGA